ncbi:MAG: pectinesterase family protein [Pseudomonadota bacterium]
MRLFLFAVCLLAIAASAQEPRHPQLSAAQAASYSMTEVLKYVGQAGKERIDPWNPLADPLAQGAAFMADYVVDTSAEANGATVFNTVQAAIDRAVSDTHAASRVYIELRPGSYHGLVYVPPAAVAITMFSNDADAARTRLRANLDAGMTGEAYALRYGAQFAGAAPAVAAMHASLREKAIIDTIGTPVLWVRNDGFQARNITVENFYNEDRAHPDCLDPACQHMNPTRQYARGPHQAVAVLVEAADKVQFENVRFIGNQDTLFLRSAAPGITVRSFFHKSYVEGDVDFIFGDTIAYFYKCEVKTLGSRTSHAYAVAPNTNYRSRYGFVFDDCDFSNDGSANALAGKFFLARQWFHRQKCTPYGPLAGEPDYRCTLGEIDAYAAPRGTVSKTVLETVGKTVVMNSRIGAHIDPQHPWSDWNTRGARSFRPVQYDSDDYWTNLEKAGIEPARRLGYPRLPREPYLAEFNNRYTRP